MADHSWDELADLAELVAVQRAEVDGRQPCGIADCRTTSAHELTLWELGRALTRTAPRDEGVPQTAFEAARRAADVLSFAVPASHRARAGKAVTGAKTAAIAGLRPVLVELLRPQHRFNVEAIEILKLLWSRKKAAAPEDSSALVRKRLGGLTDATAWSARTHRLGAAAAAVTTAKALTLKSLSPVVTPLLARQRTWNEAAVEVLARAAAVDGLSEEEAATQVLALARLREDVARRQLPSALRASAPLWNEVFRKQDLFNRELTLAVAELLGTRLPPSAPPSIDYESWRSSRLAASRSTGDAPSAARVAVLPVGFSPTAKAATPFVDSLLRQSHRNWVLVCSNGRARNAGGSVRRASTRGAIVADLDAAAAELVLVVGPSVVLHPDCLTRLVDALRGHEQGLAYSDEDRLWDGVHAEPLFKPDWSPDLQVSINYVGRCFLVSRRALVQVPPAHGDAGAALHRMALEIATAASAVVHVPEVLFHRTDRAPVDEASEEARDTVQAFLRQRIPSARVRASRFGLRPEYPLEYEPLVSIIVPYRDRPDLLERLCATLLPRTSYKNFEVLLVSNQSVLPETQALRQRLDDPRIRHLDFDEPFNYSRINNFAAAQAKGSVLVFLNNDMEVVDGEWLRELVSHAVRPEVGAVGAKLTFPDGGVQHAGVVVGLAGFAGHPFWRFTDEGHLTAWGRADWPRNLLAVTAACMAVRREVFDVAGRFDERFAVVGGDIELCLRIHARGLRNVFTPFAHLIHHESASRRSDAVPEGDYWASFLAYRPFLRRGDPFYNANLTLERPDVALRGQGEDAQALAVRTLIGTLGTVEQRAVRAHALAQRHVADHLPAFRSQAASRHSTAGGIRSIRWLVSARSESMDTVLRFARACEAYGATSNEVVVIGRGGVHPQDSRDSAPLVRFAATESDLLVGDAPDVVIATDWSTAYIAASHPGTPRRAQLVQSLGELHYAAGTFYGLAQNSYRLGLFGIFHGDGLLRRAREMHGVEGCAVALPVAPHVRRRRSPAASRRRVFVHADALDGRDAFEIALAAAAKVAAEHPSVEFVTAGAPWSGTDFPHATMLRHLGRLSADDLASLFATCDAALALGFGGAPTRAQLELMAAGVPLVVNDDAATRWLLEPDRTVLCGDPTVSCLAEPLGRLLSDEATARRIGDAAHLAVTALRWEPQVSSLLSSLSQRAALAG